MELLFLHALPLDGSMWAAQRECASLRSHAPTLYKFGNTLEEWAENALRLSKSDQLIVVGCSIGGSCALEVVALAPERVAALILIGTKAHHRPEPAQRDRAVKILRNDGMEAAWQTYWQPLIENAQAHDDIKQIARKQSMPDIVAGVTAFHSRSSHDDTLAGFDGPAIIVSGAHDPTPGVETSRAQAQSAKQGQLHVIPDCGHYVPMEQPEALNKIVLDVIAQRGG